MIRIELVLLKERKKISRPQMKISESKTRRQKEACGHFSLKYLSQSVPLTEQLHLDVRCSRLRSFLTCFSYGRLTAEETGGVSCLLSCRAPPPPQLTRWLLQRRGLLLWQGHEVGIFILQTIQFSETQNLTVSATTPNKRHKVSPRCESSQCTLLC